MSRLGTAPDRLILMGVFGAAQGVRGEMRVKSLTGDPKAIGDYGPLTDATGAPAFVFDSLRPLKDDMLVARLKGVSTREAAAALTGVEIFARRDQLPRPSDDEFYYDDLIGLDAVDAAGKPVGRVVSLMNYGARRHSRDRASRRRRDASAAVHEAGRPDDRLRRSPDRRRAAARSPRRSQSLVLRGAEGASRRTSRALERPSRPRRGASGRGRLSLLG